jgi:hypothetical protein
LRRRNLSYAEQSRSGHIEDPREARERQEADVYGAALDSTEIPDVDGKLAGEALLGETARAPEPLDVGTEVGVEGWDLPPGHPVGLPG